MEKAQSIPGKEVGRGQSIVVTIMITLIALLSMVVIFMKIAGIEI
ncbi:hypothetical protein CVH13_00297 [Dehalococcoides mccartyi]|uniref:Uncharacterized protein n=1 Tax=Dehalococcoides mccartyi TaxID=61435 RepID=A0A142V8B1_9CHLR|nr:hypothetical protein Dm11a5_0235 [Dehalococcoides mccartyi]PKH45888.1 hypothetical protein KKB3_00819 [Dehalococcoides mccartyi]PKH47704.1 hypothetical protein CVH13_00297 [Dehalococcoides mccartyi]